MSSFLCALLGMIEISYALFRQLCSQRRFTWLKGFGKCERCVADVEIDWRMKWMRALDLELNVVCRFLENIYSTKKN